MPGASGRKVPKCRRLWEIILEGGLGFTCIRFSAGNGVSQLRPSGRFVPRALRTGLWRSVVRSRLGTGAQGPRVTGLGRAAGAFPQRVRGRGEPEARVRSQRKARPAGGCAGGRGIEVSCPWPGPVVGLESFWEPGTLDHAGHGDGASPTDLGCVLRGPCVLPTSLRPSVHVQIRTPAISPAGPAAGAPASLRLESTFSGLLGSAQGGLPGGSGGCLLPAALSPSPTPAVVGSPVYLDSHPMGSSCKAAISGHQGHLLLRGTG